MFLLGLFSNLQIIIAFIDVECLVLERVTQQEHNRNQYYESTHGKTSNLTHHKPSRIKRTAIYGLLGNLRTMKLVQGKLILINFSTIFYFFFFSEILNREMDNMKRTKRTYIGLIIGQKYEITRYEC